MKFHIFNKISVRATRFILLSAFSGYQTILQLKQKATDVRFTYDIHWIPETVWLLWRREKSPSVQEVETDSPIVHNVA
jgi:hypothetical protein